MTVTGTKSFFNKVATVLKKLYQRHFPVNFAKLFKTTVFQKTNRSSRSQMFFKIGLLENFANFRGKDLCWSLFLIKLLVWRSATLLKWDTKTGVFLSCEICEILKNIFFYRTSPVAASERLKKWFYFRIKAVSNCWISWFFWSHFSSISKKIQRLMNSQTKPPELIKLSYQCNLQLVVSSSP